MTAAATVAAGTVVSHLADRLGWPCMIAPGVPRMTCYFPPRLTAPQRAFLCLRNIEVMFGGAAGGSKSVALLLAALQFVDVPGYAALILRRTYQDLVLPDALLDLARKFLAGTDAVEARGEHAWYFPSGARLVFSYLEHDGDEERYRSAQFQYVAFDELTQHTERRYRFLFSRLRRPAVSCVRCDMPCIRTDVGWAHADRGIVDHVADPDAATIARFPPAADGVTIFDVPLRMRAASNPGGPGHAWVKARFVDPTTRAADALFVPARLADNPFIDRESYLDALRRQEPVEWRRLAEGDWTVRDPGEFFDRGRVQVVPHRLGDDAQRVRRWDLAATEQRAGTDPDWTVGLLLAHDRTTGVFAVEDVVRVRETPAVVERLIRQCAEIDGRHVPIVVEQEPGASGKAYLAHLRRDVLAGWRCVGDAVRDPKDVRIRALSPVIDAGELWVTAAAWNAAFLDELDAWPNVTHDDQVDALAGAHSWLTQPRGRIVV